MAHIVNTTNLQRYIERLEEVNANIKQVRERLLDCLEELKNYWTSLDTNDRNTYVQTLNKHLTELAQLVKLLDDFKLLLVYYKEGYEEQAEV